MSLRSSSQQLPDIRQMRWAPAVNRTRHVGSVTCAVPLGHVADIIFLGHSICRVLAFGCLDAILQIDNEHQWLQYMLNNGYVNHIANRSVEVSQVSHP